MQVFLSFNHLVHFDQLMLKCLAMPSIRYGQELKDMMTNISKTLAMEVL